MSLSGDQIVAALDDIAGAVDGFSKRLEYINRNIDSLHDRVIGLENRADERLDNLTDQLQRIQERLGDIESTLDALPKDVANFLEENSVLGDARELIETLDRKERQEMLQDARSSKGRMALITFK